LNTRNYWLDVSIPANWEREVEVGADVVGFPEHARKRVQDIRPGDYILGYMTRVSRWIAASEVVSELYEDSTPRWPADTYPFRVRVRPVVRLTPETGVPFVDLLHQLSVFDTLKNPNDWSGLVRQTGRQWPARDGEIVVQALFQAKQTETVAELTGALGQEFRIDPQERAVRRVRRRDPAQ
jgi:predicted RNA-binding protein